MRMRRAQHHRMGLARPDDVVEVMAAPGQKAPVLDAANRLTDAELCHATSAPGYPLHMAPQRRNPCDRRCPIFGSNLLLFNVSALLDMREDDHEDGIRGAGRGGARGSRLVAADAGAGLAARKLPVKLHRR